MPFPEQTGSDTVCSFWDQNLDSGYGGWAGDGCKLIEDSADSASCQCTHLTNFGILVDTTVTVDTTIGHYIVIGPVVLLLCVIGVLLSSLLTR